MVEEGNIYKLALSDLFSLLALEVLTMPNFKTLGLREVTA